MHINTLRLTTLVMLTGLFSCNLAPQKNPTTTAITAKGDAIILYDNGTWEYKDKNAVANQAKINKADSELTTTSGSSTSFLVKSKIANVVINTNTEKWVVKKSDDGTSEYLFTLKDKDAFAMLITERIEMPLETLKKAALTNAQNASPDVKLVDEEVRTVNGSKILFMQMDGTVEGIKFSYLGYYFSSEKGTIQFLTYTTQNLLKENRQDMEELLNSMTIQK